MFGRLFGSSKPSKPKTTNAQSLNNSIQTLRGAITQLEKREVHLEKKIAQCLQKAKEKSKNRDKKGALFELKKKKQLENQLTSIQGKKLNLETQIMTLEDAHLNAQTLQAYQASRNAMQRVVQESDLERVDDTMDDITEAMDQVQEMNEAMAQPIGPMLDEDELEAELAELEELEADELLNDMPTSNKNTHMDSRPMDLNLPEAPSRRVEATQEEEDELAELEAMMG